MRPNIIIDRTPAVKLVKAYPKVENIAFDVNPILVVACTN